MTAHSRMSTDVKGGGGSLPLEQPETEHRNDRPLKICLLSYRSNPHCGGQGVYIKYLSRSLTALGHRVDVLSGPPYPDLDSPVRLLRLPSLDLYNPEALFRVPTIAELNDPVNLMEWLGVSTMGFPEPFTFSLRAYRYLRPRLGAYDIIHDNQCLAYGLWALSRLAPLVATIHHPITVDRQIAVRSVRSLYKKLKHWRWYSFVGMQKRVARRLLRILTVSVCAADDIRREFNIDRDRFRIAPNGIDTDLFVPQPEIERCPHRLIVTNSADTPLKGLYYLLHTVARVAAVRPVELVVVGQPKKNGGIERLIRTLGIGDRITFTGRIDAARFVRHYARATAAVIPSVYEGFGLPAGEAMACAVPVISTTGGALPEVIGDGGMLVPPRDIGALEAAIHHVFNHPKWAQALALKGYNRVQSRFTWRNTAEQTVRVYREAIDAYR